MLQSMMVHLKGVAPLLVHNAQLADPLNEFSKELKKVTAKRKKTDDDHLAMRRLEFLGSLYRDAQGQFVLPAVNIEAAIKVAARASKRGKDVEKALRIADDCPLKFSGPKDPMKRFEDPACFDVRSVKVGQSRCMRCRPMFRDWSTRVDVTFDTNILDEADVRGFLDYAGMFVGVGDFRPRFGTFEVEVAK